MSAKEEKHGILNLTNQSTNSSNGASGGISNKPIDFFGIAKVAILVIPIAFLLLGGLDLSGSSSQSNLKDTHQLQVEQLFNSIEGVTIQSVNVAYTEKTVTSTSLFTSNQTSTVPNGVVVVYSGTIKAPYDVSLAISLLLDVPIHKITMLNTKDLGGN